MAFYQLASKQIIPAGIEEVWNFISSPGNLKEITPDYLDFDITSKDLPEKIYPGMIIIYKVKPLLGIPLSWVSEITHIVENQFFVDEQRIGPYAFWHHQHLIESFEKGVLMTDIISYMPPLSFLGSLANKLFIRKHLARIFSYRENAIKKRFP